MAGIAWVDGALVAREEARVRIDDFGFRYGLTCFETMLAHQGRVFRLGAHLDRLDGSLRLFRVSPPTRAHLESAVAATLEANGLTEASVRLSVTPGVGGPPALPARGPASVVVTVEALAARPARGRLWVSSVCLDPGRAWRAAKVGQYAPYLLARAEAEEAGYEDALLVDRDDFVVETATSNVFFLVDGALVTPPLDRGPIPGVTRACLFELAPALGIAVREADLALADLARATAAFATNSVAGLEPITSINWERDGQVGKWAGRADDTVGRLAEAYRALVVEETGPHLA